MDVYGDNAVALWSSLTDDVRRADGVVRADLPTVVRIIGRRPDIDVAGLLAAAPRTRSVTVEDPYGTTSADVDATVLRLPVMVRPPGPIRPVGDVVRVTDADGLADAERVAVDGFPLAAYQPYRRGVLLPPRVLDSPGWTVWLARRHGEPAAAVCAYDDGRAAGIYWLATLPAHRSAGLARAVLTHALAAHPERFGTLVATEAGLPLYESLGFATVSMSQWYIRVADR